MDTSELIHFLKARSLKLVTAESCTAGLIASSIADVEGAGDLLECAFVAYSPAAKERCLGVRPETIARFNLTSEAVAREMAEGALRGSCASLAISNTGVTDDVDPDIPAGTQCYGWAFRDGDRSPVVFSETRQFDGDRNEIRRRSADYALARIPHWHALFEARHGAPTGSNAASA
ncbi:CinA family protein [Rhizobacter sp. Root1221]|uniref:CinA family protein n=1 Tax=Rhizobacter sp. Root1221 TaxID=1736433 RepID=UPI0007003C87|nr:CinA family protein [Rhizobacter sp. Root1221]KQW00881.1 ompetence-damaged protein [Rhizobacter sp. Root1221]